MRLIILAGAMLVWCGEVGAEGPTKKDPVPSDEKELLPPPKVLVPQLVPQLLPPQVLPPLPERPPQFGQRGAWEYFAPNFRGQFMPRVIYSPYGSYYLYNGAPYPWTRTRTTYFMPYVVD